MPRILLSPLPAVVLTATVILGACSSELTSIAPEFASRGSRGPLSVTPSSLQLTSPGLSKTFTATVQYAGRLTASSSNPRCAAVSPTSTTSREKPGESSVCMAQFTVTPVSAGSCTVTVTDKKGNVAYVGVSIVLARIAFSHPTIEPATPYQIYVMDPNGQNQTRVSYSSFDEYQPAWSPDRTKIAFVVLGFGGEEIYVMDADGQNPTQPTYDSNETADLAWR